MQNTAIRVMLVDDNTERADLVEQRLHSEGAQVVSRITSATGLLFQMEQHRPDVVVMDIESPDRDVLESLSLVSAHNPTPVVMFSSKKDPSFINEAVSAGVTAYQVAGINPDYVKPVIDVAIAQFRSFQTLRQQLDDTKNQLADRKIIEKAKGLLMTSQNISEEEAFKTMRGVAMDTNQRMSAVAKSVITMFESSVEEKK